jgi:DNA polymerase
MCARAKGDFEKYIRQQIDMGFDEAYLPFGSKPLNLSPRPRPTLAEQKGAMEKGPSASRESTPVRESAPLHPTAVHKSIRDDLPALPIERFAEAESLDQLYRSIKDCQRCPLGKTRTKFVFGDGDPHAEIMFIGEAPGRDEDLQGIPFVGRAGKLLDKMLVEIGVRRADVYIANILKSRPPENRDPEPEEAETCEPYLHAQIKLIKPKIICSLGRIAAQTLLKTKMTLGEMRGRWFNYQGTKFMVTYHPAAILRAMNNYDVAIGDLKRLFEELEKMRG